ncbi:MAG: glutamate racemase [Cyanobacteria bacterium]|nr:glutamate racemase [Cyanobacteriota bacterium]
MQSLVQNISRSWNRIDRIGLFDSGVGGLSVLRSFLARPEAQGKEFVYIGDTLRCPYGDRPRDEISLFVMQLCSWLLQQDIDLLVMSCNTSAALVKEELLARSPVPVVDLLAPTAASIARHGVEKVGVIATAATANQKAFSRSIRQVDSRYEVVEIGCPLLVPVVEAGLAEGPEGRSALIPYVSQLLAEGVEAIVYGCTHYPFLDSSMRAALERLSPEPIVIIDPAEELMNELFGKQPPVRPVKIVEESSHRIVTTGDAKNFARIASRCLGYEIGIPSNITIKELQVALAWQTSMEAAGSGASQLSPGAVS